MSDNKTKGEEILGYANDKINCDYKFGSTGPNEFDCSGLTQWAHAQAGIAIPRTAEKQGKGGVPGDGSAGDIVAFGNPITHVGICVGNGTCVHAPGENKVVKVAPIKYINKVYCFRRYW